MNTLEVLAVRKAIKRWRDQWTEHISKDLDASIPELKSLLFSEVDKIEFVDALRAKRYTTEKLQPLFVDWCRKKEEDLLTAAENDLRNQFKRVVEQRSARSEMEINISKESLLDIAGAALSGAATAATIPAMLSFSAATVSAGGIMGLFGATTTVLVTRNILIGLIVLTVLLLFTYRRSSKVTINVKTRLRKQIEQQIQEKVVYSKKRPSLAMVLTEKIESTAKQLLGELEHAA